MGVGSLLKIGFVFAGEVYGGRGGFGYFTAYAPSRTLNTNIVAAKTSAKSMFSVSFGHIHSSKSVPIMQNHRNAHRSWLEFEIVKKQIANWREGRGRRLEKTTIRMKPNAFMRIRWRASARYGLK